jgi:hypothetical protein
MSNEPQPDGSAAAQPYYLPGHINLDLLPTPLRLTLERFLEPAYRHLVVEAGTPLEQSAGISFVFLLALEIVDQFALGKDFYLLNCSDEAIRAQLDKQIARYLRVVGAKRQTSDFLLRIAELRKKDSI